MWSAIKWTALVAIVVVQFLNHTGFCYRDMRYYSEIEIEKMVRGRNAARLGRPLSYELGAASG